jgi:hypothetical protein
MTKKALAVKTKLRNNTKKMRTAREATNRLITDVTVQELQYRVDTVKRVSAQRRIHNFIDYSLYSYFHTRSRFSSPRQGKTFVLRTDSNGLSHPMYDERRIEIE